MTPEFQQKIYDLRTRILKKEPVTQEELREAIQGLRAARATRAAQAAIEKPRRRKAAKGGAVPMSMEDLNKLFEQKKGG
jgi:ADP-dependent phosphofructokinase/glucokinase